MKQEELIKSCREWLIKLYEQVKLNNALNYYDINTSSEYFYISILNQIFDCNLRNINAEARNSVAIDLCDEQKKLAIQVTSDSSSNKIRSTIKKYCKKMLYKKYDRLILIVIEPSHKYRANFSDDTEGKFLFSHNDIYTIDKLLKAISALNIEKISTIHRYLEFQLGTLLDESQVVSISQSFEYISKSTNGYLNESFFEIDDNIFLSYFKEKFNKSDILYISALSAEEARYCILNYLHKTQINKNIYIIKSKEVWNKAEKYFSDSILIPDFQSNEIPAIKNNKTIFIQSVNSNREAIKLPSRTTNFLANKLFENGYSNPYILLQRTQGLYFYIKYELFEGDLKIPDWTKDNNKAIVVASLLGKWTTCDGDRCIIEELYGASYKEFIQYLSNYIDVEDALVVEKIDVINNKVYELSDPLISICSHKKFFESYISTFFELAKKVILEHNPSIGAITKGLDPLSKPKDNNYSHALKTGMLRTLILLSLYDNKQDIINNYVESLLSSVNSVQDWIYISKYIGLLCEASPDAVLTCIQKNLDTHTKLLDLFTTDSLDLFSGKDCYKDVICCLEHLLPFKDYAVQSIQIILNLCESLEGGSANDYLRSRISKVFGTLYNLSCLSVNEKIEFAKICIDSHPFFWDILYGCTIQRFDILGCSGFAYRETEHPVQYTEHDILTLRESYIEILFSHINGIDELVKLTDILPDFIDGVYTNELFNDIQKIVLSEIENFSDDEKERLKTALRKVIYNYRILEKTKQVQSRNRIKMIESICSRIVFEDNAYDFLYLTVPYDVPISAPVALTSDKYWYQNNNLAIEKTVASEISRMKSLGVDLAHFLSLRKITSYTPIGKWISKFYSVDFDEKLFDKIVSATNCPFVAIDYVCNCSDSNCSESNVYKALEYLKVDHFCDDFYVGLVSVLPLDTRSYEMIKELPEESAHKYWSGFLNGKLNSTELLSDVINNLLKYCNWNALYSILYNYSSLMGTEQILTIISNSVIKMIDSKDIDFVNSYQKYLIQRLLSVVYQRVEDCYVEYPTLFNIEMHLFSMLEWNNLKCSQFLFKHNAKYYANLLSICYPKDGILNDDRDSDLIAKYFVKEMFIKFCPGEENGTINNDVLNKWISDFKNYLTEQSQVSLFYKTLGKLFACSPYGSDGLFPHEIIRQKIEEFYCKELENAFVSSFISNRGGYTSTAGYDEYKLSQEFEVGNLFLCRYPNTSKIIKSIKKYYKDESERERKIAENNLFA